MKYFTNLIGPMITILMIFSCASKKTEHIHISNPISEGYYADPAIVKHNDSFFIFATIDPWGGDELGVLVSEDFTNWEKRHINWPTKEACTSPTSGDAMVWAPSVIKAKNGRFYMYVSVGSEVWAGVADHPLGPWKNAKDNDSPLIPRDLYPDYHMIDADCFIDTDGQAYLYWGSGLNWVNGGCFVVKLKEDMITFDGEIQNVTPPNYFEGPLMVKNNSKYYLMYSDGKVIDTTYKVRYSIGDTPFGPWMEGKNSPILHTGIDNETVSPGHHTVFKEGDQHYILYHRHSTSSELSEDGLLRELCIDSLIFTSDGEIQEVKPRGIKKFK